MRRLRDVFYINASEEEKGCYFYYGLEFREFIKFYPASIRKILLLEPALYSEPINSAMFMSTLNGEAISELAEQGAYDFGNFHWMDYRDEDGLARCSEQEKAEILYLSHFGKPLNDPFFQSIANNIVYLSHDDGWFCKLYCKDPKVMGDIIANKIGDFFSGNKRRKIYPFGDEIKSKLLDWTKKGLLVDFSEAEKTGKHWGLRLYSIGKYSDMDEMYHDIDKKKRHADRYAWLHQADKQWKLD